MRVASSNIKEIEYNADERELTVIFINRPNWKYVYRRVPKNVWVTLQRTKSKGQYFRNEVEGKYQFTKIVE